MKFNIDLNTLSKKKLISSKKDFICLISAVILSFMVFGYPINRYYEAYLPSKQQAEMLGYQIKSFSQKKQELEKNIVRINKRKTLIGQLRNEGICWTDKLVYLARLSPDKMWLTQLKEETATVTQKGKNSVSTGEHKLTVRGEFFPKSNQGYVEHIVNFNTDLNNTDCFHQDILPFSLVSVNPLKQKNENLEVMEFELSGRFK